jgi:N-acetylglutamate synthase-like GNAT family acetyltransferase
MDIRPYTTADRDPCLAVLHSHTQPRLPGDERFQTFLEILHGPFFVMEHDAAIVGCGGYVLSPETDSARLLWGMVRSDLQRQGLGRFLLMFRLREIGKHGDVRMVHALASKSAAPFFEKQGFRTLSVSDDGVELVKKLAVCA